MCTAQASIFFQSIRRREKMRRMCIVLIFRFWYFVPVCLCWNLHYVHFFDAFYCLPVSVITFLCNSSQAQKKNSQTSTANPSIGMLFVHFFFRLRREEKNSATWFNDECLDKLLRWDLRASLLVQCPESGTATCATPESSWHVTLIL